MKRLIGFLAQVEAQVELEVVECDCGYHMGIDATYLDQVGDFATFCPSCGAIINTAELCPEDTEDIIGWQPQDYEGVDFPSFGYYASLECAIRDFPQVHIWLAVREGEIEKPTQLDN